MKYAFSLLIALITIGIAVAQVIECPILENAAFAEARIWCADTQPGQWCYGNSDVRADITEGEAALDAAGDKMDLQVVRQLNTNTGGNLWGVAYAQLEAYPMTGWLPTPTTLVLLGDASLIDASTENADTPVLTLEVTEVDRVNIRSRPTLEARAVAGAARGDFIKAFGRLSNDTWLQVQSPRGETGWVSSSIVSSDFAALPVVTPDDQIEIRLWSPYTAFYLSSSPFPARCAQAPESGILLQTNRDAAYRFWMNGAVLELSGTAFIQAAPETGLLVQVVEGEAVVSSQDVSIAVEAGDQTSVALARNPNGLLTVSGVPGEPETYDNARLLPLPMRLLPRPAYVSFDLQQLIRPRPEGGVSPLGEVLVTDPCMVTVGTDGVNLRAGPGTDFEVRGTINFRESALPVGRARGTDGNHWWQLAPDLWISGETTVTGGDCANVPNVEAPTLPPPVTPTATAQP